MGRVLIALAPGAALICLFSAGASGATRMAFTFATDPARSPDGKKIAFVASPSPTRLVALYLMNSDGTAVRQLTPAMRPSSPTWSPDGKRLAFGLSAVRGGGIFVVNRDGSGLHQIAKHGHAPAWGPGGRKIAFVRDGSIRAMNTDGTRPELVAVPDYLHTYDSPTWSPDGQRLAFSVDHAQDSVQPKYLGVVSRYRGPVKAELYDEEVWSPDWSPQGRQIIFDRTRGPWDQPVRSLYVLDLATHRAKLLRDGREADWSADGRRIVYAEGNLNFVKPTSAIYVMNADGSHVRQLTRA